MKKQTLRLYTAAVLLLAYIIASVLIFRSDALILQPGKGNTKWETTFGHILRDHPAVDSFRCEDNNLQGISIRFGTYERVNTCNLTVTLQEAESGEIIFQRIVSASKLKDNAEHRFVFEPLPYSAGKTYGAHITSDADRGSNAVTVWTADPEKAENGRFVTPLYMQLDVRPFLWIVFTALLALAGFLLFRRQMRVPVRWAIVGIYAFFFLFCAFKMSFYSGYVGGFPDEDTHIAYIAYLEQSGTVLPNFFEMHRLDVPSVLQGTFECSWTDQINYLGHPPLYYHLMRLSGGVRVLDNGWIRADIARLRSFSMGMFLIAMSMAFYIGYSRLKKSIPVHLLYASALTSIPMFCYDGAAVNNDTLAFLGCMVFLLGGLRYAGKKADATTFLLLSGGAFVTVMSKLTAGLILFSAAAIFILWGLLRRDLVWNRWAFCVLPFVAVAGGYYLFVYRQVGALQPILKLLAPDQFLRSNFYIPPENRIFLTFPEYFQRFFENFFDTWTGIASHVSLIKPRESKIRLTFTLLCWTPALLLFLRRKTVRDRLLLCTYAGVVCTALVQCLRAWLDYSKVSGYLGAYQSRYYLCAFAAMALATGILLERLAASGNAPWFRKLSQELAVPLPQKRRRNRKKNKKHFRVKINRGAVWKNRVSVLLRHSGKLARYAAWGICVVWSGILLYADFVYFLLHFHEYL